MTQLLASAIAKEARLVPCLDPEAIAPTLRRTLGVFGLVAGVAVHEVAEMLVQRLNRAGARLPGQAA